MCRILDADSDSAMEFVGPQAKLPEGSWTPELNFLAWQPYQDKQALDLPGGTTYRLSMQWTEPHDPSYFFRPDDKDWYLLPLAGLQLVVLRQRDPAGTALSEDDFEEVARSFMLPQRLDNQLNSSTYEIFVTWKADRPGRYAVRVERTPPSRWFVVPDKETGAVEFKQLLELTPTGIRPLGAPTLPAIEKQWELQPRLFIQATEGAAFGHGRPVFRDFVADLGTIPALADSRVLISVGAAGPDGKAEPFSAAGPPAHLELFAAPAILSFDRLDVELGGKKGPAFGTSLATPFAAGTAAVTLSAGTAPDQLLHQVQQQHKKAAATCE
jgi:hypothetical protein